MRAMKMVPIPLLDAVLLEVVLRHHFLILDEVPWEEDLQHHSQRLLDAVLWEEELLHSRWPWDGEQQEEVRPKTLLSDEVLWEVVLQRLLQLLGVALWEVVLQHVLQLSDEELWEEDLLHLLLWGGEKQEEGQ